MRRLTSLFRITLGELLVVATAALVGLAALRMGGVLGAAVEFFAVAIAVGIAVFAIIRGGVARTFAIGFFVATLTYGGMLYWHGEDEFDPAKGRMFATQTFAPLYDVVKRDVYFDLYRETVATSEEEAELASLPRRSPSSANLEPSYFGMSDADRVVQTQYRVYRFDEYPGRREFMSVAHVLTALLLGYGMGKFAILVQRPQRASSHDARDQRPVDSTAENRAPA